MRKLPFLLLAAFAPVQAFAANQVALDNSVFVERVTTDASGKQRVLLEEPKVVVPGDRLVGHIAGVGEITATIGPAR